MLLKPCSRCKRMIPYGNKYCDKCKPIIESEFKAKLQQSKRESNKRYNKRRDPKYAQFYRSKQWRMLSASYMQKAGYKCEAQYDKDCRRFASEVHHIIPIQTEEGWARRLDITNLRAVCTHCHNIEHNRFKNKTKIF